ncbi:MAG: hypothetical protein R2798_02265 [Chitinophagales bacterium]|nr:hypothetical protein [Bacteroidota bacterium]MCB9042147.1 hypothetical protein [Chitinophagales bacterium]
MRNLRFILALWTVLGVLCATQTKAQSFQEGNLILSGGTSLGLYGYSGFDFTIPIFISGEYGITDEIGIGGFYAFSQRAWSSDKDYRYRFTALGVRAAVHLTDILNRSLDTDINDDEWDFYIAAYMGLEYNRIKYSGNNFLNNEINARVVIGPTLGIRYYFKPRVGFFAELGRGAVGYTTLGLSVRMN